MKRALVLNAVGAALAIGVLLLAEPSLAADDKCRSDSGIPSGVVRLAGACADSQLHSVDTIRPLSLRLLSADLAE